MSPPVSGPKKVRLDAIRAPVLGVVVFEGTDHEVRQMNFETHHLLESVRESGDVAGLRQAVASVVPTLTAEQVGRLNFDQAEAILSIAGGNIAKVEQLFPNAVSPETPTSPG